LQTASEHSSDAVTEEALRRTAGALDSLVNMFRPSEEDPDNNVDSDDAFYDAVDSHGRIRFDRSPP